MLDDASALSTSKARTWVPLVLPSLAAFSGLFVAAHAPKGGVLFYVSTFFVAGVYLGSWALWGRHQPVIRIVRARRDVLNGLAVGSALLVLFLLGAQAVRFFPALEGPVQGLLDNARFGPLWVTILTTALNGVGEELYFRHVVPDTLLGTEKVRWFVSLAMYVAVTAAMGVPLLAVAAVAVGGAALWQRKRTEALISPIVLHVSWSLGMLLLLPYVL